jgi:predicted nucleotidyltransferase
MRKHIIEQLRKLEATRNIKILYAVESGSRAWGFASENSDWDIRFLYVHPIDWYLQIGEKKDNIQLMWPNELDLSGWDLRKALGLFRKSNPSLMEWLQSPIIYIENEAVISEWKELTGIYFNPKNMMYHYLNIARNTYKKYLNQEHLKLKKYFYAIRPLLACRWIETHGTMPPVLFDKMLETFDNKDIRAIIDELVIDKKAGNELVERSRILLLNDFITTEIAYFDRLLKNFDVNKKQDSEDLNIFFRKILKMKLI